MPGARRAGDRVRGELRAAGAYDPGVSAEPETPEAAETALSASGTDSPENWDRAVALSASDAVALLRRLIAFNTVNPPGNELPAQQHLHALLTDAGFECELLGAVPERPNLVARLRRRPTRRGPTLCYLGHVDTVLADPAEWSRGPVVGGARRWVRVGQGGARHEVAGRRRGRRRGLAGALGLAAGARGSAGRRRGRRGDRRRAGAPNGSPAPTPRRCAASCSSTRAAARCSNIGGRRRYGVCCAEKGIFRFTVTTDGVAGHASMPKIADNALLKMGPVLERLAARQPAYTLTAEPAAFLRGIGEDPEDPAGAVANLRAADPRLASMFEPMLGVTFAPTRIRASEKINVIPSRAEVKVDCRVPPGLGEAEVLRGIEEVLGPRRPDHDRRTGPSSGSTPRDGGTGRSISASSSPSGSSATAPRSTPP